MTKKIKANNQAMSVFLILIATIMLFGVSKEAKAASIVNKYTLTDYGAVSSFSADDMVVGKWKGQSKGKSSVLTISEDGNFTVSNAGSFQTGTWEFSYNYLELTSKTGNVSVFRYYNQDTIKELGGSRSVYHIKRNVEKPATVSKKVSIKKVAGYWRAETVMTTEELQFTNMYMVVNKSGKMSLYVQKGYNDSLKRSVKNVKLSLSKSKDCFTFKTKLNGKTVKGSIYYDRGQLFVKVGNTGILLSKSSKTALSKAQRTLPLF